MLEYIKGTLSELNPAYAIVDNHGMGYLLNISLSTYDPLSRLKADDVACVYVYEAIREDAHVLYGFFTKRERELFLLLISVSGVGPNTARMILSSMQPSELEQSISCGDVAMLKAVKGVGAKTAQRIIVDLKDKIKLAGDTFIQEKGSPSSPQVFDEALSALVMLGFTQQASQKALKRLFASHHSLTVEEAIKQALKMM
ncbi:MAG: Holliday junction branch migration protein RuvA [Muribaculaceae bacterium]|nr:Holliday junction branch migration protein RuvA [Muribaculaceae bacterium]